jgi:predicted AlkP superfamily phosphohydrolase/phosphomutase
LGYLVPPAPPDGGETPRRRFSVGGIKDRVPKGARRWIADRLPWWLRDRIGARIRAAAIDWSRTRAFTLPTDLEGCIRVNLKGREPEGIVLPEEYDALCREIADQFAQLVNPATGRPAVRKVWIRNEIFPGPAQEHLPDIMVSWDGSSTIEALYSDATGTLELVLPDPRTGTHSSSGFCVAAGAGFGRGVSAGGRLEDVAPTVLSLLCAEEAGMDGRSLTIPS